MTSVNHRLKALAFGLFGLAISGCATANDAATSLASAAATPAAKAAPVVDKGVKPDLFALAPISNTVKEAIVKTDAGYLVGETIDGVDIFRGVPYAAPPVGENRWKEPQPVEPWSGYRSAYAFEPACPQPVDPSGANPNGGGVVGAQSEDCLYLEVYAPEDATDAPVVLWMHGGAFFLGAGHLGSYVGTENAKKGVITVSINYRLGSLGFFAHPSLDGQDSPQGNFAMMDAVAALEWIKANIGEFGGDTDNVTIAGQSAGGFLVVSLLSTPSAEGLFHKAVIQSGAGLVDGKPLDKGQADAIAALKTAGIPADATADQIRSLSAQTFSYNEKLRAGMGIMLDGAFDKVSTKDAFANNTEFDVPVLVGSNSGEPGFSRARTFAELASKDGAGAWLYHFRYMPDFRKPAWKNGPIHSAELMFSFDSLETSGWSMGKTDASDDAYADKMSSCWIAFYKMDPESKSLNCASGFTWPAYTTNNDAVAVFDEAIAVGKASVIPDGPKR